MTTYVVTFEVASPQVRERLLEKLKSFNGYCPIHANCWAVASPETSAQLLDSLTPLITNSDRIFVIRSGTEAAWINAYGEEHTTWLKNNL